MKNILLVSAALMAFTVATAQTDSMINTQLNRQRQNKTSMNKAAGNQHSPSTANIEETRKVRVMVRKTNDKASVKSTPATTAPVSQAAINSIPPPENVNKVTPSVVNGNAGSQKAGTKVPEPK